MLTNQPNQAARADDPLTIFPRILNKLFSVWVRYTYPFRSIGQAVSIHHTVTLNRRIAPAISIGNNVMIRKDAWLNTFDISDVSGPTIVIGDNCLIGAGNVISAKNSIHIEHDVIFGKNALLQDHNHAYEETERPIKDQGLSPGGKIRIGQGSWIGHGAAIVCGSGELVLGRNCVVAANALVTRSFPPYSVIVGNPARLARQFDPERGLWMGPTGHSVIGVEVSSIRT